MSFQEPPESRNLEIQSLPGDTSHLIALRGELDLKGCPAVEAELHQVEAIGVERIVVDLSGLDFIDSTGIGVLVAAMRRSQLDGDRLRFVRSRSGDVCRLFELCGLEASLPFIDATPA
jgi:anti-sigma B factor antagonist